MNFNKWWGLLVGLIISTIVGIPMGGFKEDNPNLARNNLIAIVITAVCFGFGWWYEKKKNEES